MRRIAHIVLTIGITGLILCGTESWLAAHEPRRPAIATAANPFAPVAVAGASHVLQVMVDEVDEPDVDESPTDNPTEAEASEPEAKTGKIESTVFDPPTAVTPTSWADDIVGMSLNEWADDEDQDDEDSSLLLTDDEEDTSADDDVDLADPADDPDATADAEPDEL